MAQGKVSYFPVWERYLEQLRSAGIDYEDAGRLFYAMMETQFGSGDAQAHLQGMSKVIWPFIQPDLEQARAKYEACIENGKKGGRRKTEPFSEQTQPNPDITQPNPEKPKTKTRSMSKTRSKTKTKTSISSGEDMESPPAQAQEQFGEYGWVKLTGAEHEALLSEMGHEELQRCIRYLDTSAQSSGNKNGWKDWALVLRRCHAERWGINREVRREPPVDRYAISCTLGDAEMAALRRMLEESQEDNHGPP